MNYIKKVGKIYKIVEQECSIEDLEFHRKQQQQHMMQIQAELVTLDAEIKEMKKL